MWKVSSRQWRFSMVSNRVCLYHRQPPLRLVSSTVASLRTPNESTSDPWRNHPSLRFENRRGNTLERSFSSAILSDDGTSNVIPFILADIGEGIAEVELLQWFVQEGDQVHQFDRVCEVQSDKATVEITSRYDGLITSLEHKTGGMVKVGSPLLFIESDDEAAVSNLHSTASTQAPPMEDDEKLQIPSIASQYHLSTDDQDEAEQLMASAHLETDTSFSSGGSAGIEEEEAFISRLLTPRPASSTKVLTTPAIRKLAAEYSLDLSTIVGTGPKGRVLKGDVLTVLRERGLTTTTPQQQQNDLSKKATQASSTPERDVSSKNGSTITCIDQAELPLGKDTVMEIRGYNRLMVQSMTASLQIPHMVYADEINVTGLRTQYKSNLPFLPYCIKAASMALSKYPLLNASFDADANQVLLWSDHNIGIAMDTPRGLIVPVVKQVQHKSLVEIASELRRLKEFAKDGSVPAEDLQGATFTLSNIGAIGGGGTYMSPIVTSPQVAIGALGQVQRVPRFVSENSTEVYEAHIVNVSWGGDHRVVDGATMARFHTQWKEYLQDPISLIQEMK